MDRPSLRYRLRYLWPPNETRLFRRLCDAIEAGVLDVWTAERVFFRETRILPPWLSVLLHSPIYPSFSFFLAANKRYLLERLARTAADFKERELL